MSNSSIYIGNSRAAINAVGDLILQVVNSSAADKVKTAAIAALGKGLSLPPTTITNCNFSIGNHDNNCCDEE